jgi:uncharacterized protein YegP (UPF0339 family)
MKVKIMAKFQIFKDVNGKHRFRLRANNGEIIATSEAYNSKQAAQDGIQAVKASASSASTEDLT